MFRLTRVGSCLLLSGAVLMVSGCGETKAPNAKAEDVVTKRVFCVSYPLQFLTQQITGGEIEVLVPFGENDNPWSFRPSREVISQMQSADLVIANGTGAKYAKWLDTVSLAESKVVKTASRGLSLRDYIAIENAAVVHSHGPEGEHSHAVMAIRPWLDPALAKKQAAYITEQLGKVYPDQAEVFSANLRSLNTKLERLTEKLNAGDVKGSPVVLSLSPKFKFLSRAAALDDKTVTDFEADESSLPDLEAFKSGLEKQLAKFEPQPTSILVGSSVPLDREPCKSLSIFGLNPVVIDSLDHQPADGDYLSVLEGNIERVLELRNE